MSSRTYVTALAIWVAFAANAVAGTPPGSPVSRTADSRADAQAQPATQTTPQEDNGWKIEIAPIYAWVPINISSITLPPFPDLPKPPGGGDRPSGGTDASLSGAAMAAIRIEKQRFTVRANVVYAGLAGERERPYVRVSGKLIYGEALAGVRVARGLWLEGGVRRLAVDVSGEVADYPKVSRRPGIWDPVVGASVRLPLGERWLLTVHGDGGGFGVGSEIDLNSYATLDWRMARHVGLTVGYSLLYVRLENEWAEGTRLAQKLDFGTTLAGPIVGFKLLF